ncbi:hypothetical protein B0D95_02730 [Cellvibrio sp. PSBB023]|nr:hypothetical protein B0D95_02730 [Cellvibrio sp. PSBB023]
MADEKPKKVIVITDADALVLEKKLRVGQRVCNLSYIALLLMLTLNFLLSNDLNLMHLLVAIVPLAIFIPGLRKPHHRTYSWLCFVLLMYFLFLVPLLMSYWSLTYWVLTLLVTLLFVAAMMTSRWLQYWNYYLSTKQ